jgi:hypothetical protein
MVAQQFSSGDGQKVSLPLENVYMNNCMLTTEIQQTT